ncbi:MAG TPA: aldehyde dehydrogenase family protein [Anaerolineales bacterium]|nr:aldehyde dehydrogenase family protein [Anaerolineales bacterium]HNH78108.1 aldehyde dehydrogenase family protein [Anaerolineales bacterium]HNJ14608.1 aldehyde dehydrogenase family protein [Anaerolineales bacterium]HUM25821.1 aldehyde dehydrogenase family protein [Anaerolineales bacterium]
MRQMLINGKFTNGNATEEIEVQNPATEEVIESVPRGTPQDVEDAVQAAKSAFDSWRKLGSNERARLLHEVADRVHEHREKIVHMLTLEEGKPVSENEEEVEWVINTFHYYAELGRHHRGSVLASGEASQFNFIIKEPYGVVGCIVPWNYPLLLLAWKVAPALAAGNTVVIKPSEMTPLTALYLAKHCFNGLPAGVVNVVTGYGLETGEPLVKHPDVPVIAFTGSLATGQRIASIAAPMMKKLHLELGGKDATVIAEDADPEIAAKAVAYAALINAGQVCTSTERVYLPKTHAAKFTEAIVEHVKSLKLGPGLDPKTDMGPMIGETFRAKFEKQLVDARASGAKILTGGARPQYLEKGFFHEPTVLTGVNHSMVIMREETFGPAVPIMEYTSFDEAIQLTNDCQYGLGAVLISNDPKKIKRFFDDVKAGTIWINDPLTDNYAGPFGGMKYSGGARELGEEGLEEFRETKHVHWDFNMEEKGYWFPYGR